MLRTPPPFYIYHLAVSVAPTFSKVKMPSQREAMKTCKSLLLTAIKNGDSFSAAFRTVLALCALVSIASALYVALSAHHHSHSPPSPPPCPQERNSFEIRTNPSYDNVDFETNLSHILFGIGGSAKTWNKRRSYCELWWEPSATRGYVWLDSKPPAEAERRWPGTSPPYRVSEGSPRSANRIARIVKESFQLGVEDVRWFVMGDDDTVFFTENLVTVLGRYDHNQMYYIGGGSESVEQSVVHSFGMAFGGGGFAISHPLAAELVGILDGCVDRYASFYGSDQKVHACVSEIGVPLTKEPGFHQVDIRGNPYGLLAAHPLAPLVSLHHLDHVQSLFADLDQMSSLKKLVGAYKKDPGRTLQRSFCYDLSRNWSVSVSWGYTVQLYPTLVTAKDLETAFQTFQTWRSWRQEPFTFDTRPMSFDPCERPVLYFLDRVESTGPDRTLTLYKKFVAPGDKECNRGDYGRAHSIKVADVSASILQPDLWKKAPRRQCCNVTYVAGSVLHVDIKSCKKGESVTPP